MRVIVFGYGRSGQKVTEWFINQQFDVTVMDQKLIESNLFQSVLDTDSVNFANFDLLVLSPGISLSHPQILKAKESTIEIVGEMEFVLRQIQNPCIAITGTNGKTSVTTWISQALNFCGIEAVAMGNIGFAISDLLIHPKPKAVIILEVSSFQLETIQSKPFDLGVILNLEENHLDWHASFDEYANAKIHLQDCLKPNRKLLVSEKVLKQFHQRFSQRVESYEKKHFPEKWILEWEKKYLFLQNMQAVFSIVKEFDLNDEQIYAASKHFKKPAHRMEIIYEKNEICFYNDSKATNVAAVIHAIEQLNSPIILIAGGKDKRGSYESWIVAFQNKVKKVLLIGEAQEKIYKTLFPSIDVEKVSTLNQAVAIAWKIAKEKDAILFSPGCSSYDQFQDFEQRGEEFKKIVKNLFE